jgi:hypothetical protein
MENDKSNQQVFKPAVTPPNTPTDQAELLRRIRQGQSPASPPLRVHPYMSGRQQAYSQRPPEAH